MKTRSHSKITHLLSEPVYMMDQWGVYLKKWDIMTQSEKQQVCEKLDNIQDPNYVEHIKNYYLPLFKEKM